jgi:hypothetical protein
VTSVASRVFTECGAPPPVFVDFDLNPFACLTALATARCASVGKGVDCVRGDLLTPALQRMKVRKEGRKAGGGRMGMRSSDQHIRGDMLCP